MSYSQNDEEAHILALFNGKPPGRLLDVGAYTGKEFSNSLALIERGWEGVLVEPNPNSLVALIALHGKNPRVKIVGGLITPQTRLTEFYTCDDAVSTTNKAFTPMWENIGVKFNPIWLPGVTPEALATFTGDVDFITIDVEDGTLDVVDGLASLIAKASVICVEHSVGTNVIKTELRDRFINAWGFRLVHETPENYIFSR